MRAGARVPTVLTVLLALTAGFAGAQPAIALAARSIRPGEVVAVTISAAADAAPVIVNAFGREWPVYADGAGQWRALVGIDLDTRPGPHALRVTTASGR